MGMVRGIRLREDDILPYDVGGNRTKRLQDKRGITYTDVRSRGGGREIIDHRMSFFRHGDKAAKSRRLPRGVFGQRKPGKLLGWRLKP